MRRRKGGQSVMNGEENACGQVPEHIHEHMHGQIHEHIHEQVCPRQTGGHPEHDGHRHTSSHRRETGEILTIRSHSGLSGDMFMAGLAILALERNGLMPASSEGEQWLSEMLNRILPELKDSVKIVPKLINGITGWSAKVDLPHVHEHRNVEDIQRIIQQAAISDEARASASRCFELIAECEAAVHGLKKEAVHFHEVGALDSILDICATCELFWHLAPHKFVCGPLPVADGMIECAHGILPAPAPAVLRLLCGVPLRPFEGELDAGELVTPTAIALLLALNVEFGTWPAFRPQNIVLVYGSHEFKNAPNGAIFALGKGLT